MAEAGIIQLTPTDDAVNRHTWSVVDWARDPPEAGHYSGSRNTRASDCARGRNVRVRTRAAAYETRERKRSAPKARSEPTKRRASECVGGPGTKSPIKIGCGGRATGGTCSCGPGRRDRHCHAARYRTRKCGLTPPREPRAAANATLAGDNVARAPADTMKPVVIVAGVGPGIGTSVARAFGAEGFAIALLARDSARLAKRHAELTAVGITAAPFIVDLADAAATLNSVEQVRAWAGGDPASLVYNAFALQQCSADQLDQAESQRAMRVNFLAATQLTALVAPAMRASGTGSLLFTGGGAALRAYAGLSSLCAGKAALRMWALTLAEDLAGTGVRVGTVTVHGPVERGTPFDPDEIAAALVRLHRGTNEGIEIHFMDGASPLAGMHDV